MKKLTDEMNLLKKIMKAIAAEVGTNCEVVLHDYEGDYDRTIAAIENGHVTGRKVGDCGTNLGLEVLRGTISDGDKYGYFTQTNDGRVLKSSSVYFHDETGKAIGALCINWDISNLLNAEQAIKDLLMIDQPKEQPIKEVISPNVGDILDSLIHESLIYVGKPVDQMTKEDKMKGLRYLDEKGAFLIKKAGDKVTEFYHISKYTLYNYLEQCQKK